MRRIPSVEKPAAALCGREKHPITPGVWRAVGHAVLHHMNVNAGPQRLVEAFFVCTFNYFFDGKVVGFRMLAMQKSSSNPHLISDFDYPGCNSFHSIVSRCMYIDTKYLRLTLKCQAILDGPPRGPRDRGWLFSRFCTPAIRNCATWP